MRTPPKNSAKIIPNPLKLTVFTFAAIATILFAVPATANEAVQPAPAKKSWFQRHFGRPAWQEITGQGTTPQEVCRIVDRYVNSRQEDQDQWAGPLETWQRGYGDCEDFAVCIQELCQGRGFEASVYLFYNMKPRAEGHAVVVGQWNGKTWMSSLGAYKEVASLSEVKKEVSKVLGCKENHLWSMSLAHADVQRFLKNQSGRTVGLAERSTGVSDK